MDTGYASDESMSRHYADSDLSDAPPDETVILLAQSSSPEHEENDDSQFDTSILTEDTQPADLQASTLADVAQPADRPVARLGSTTVQFRGYYYAKYHVTREGTILYRCSAYRRTKCKAKMYVSGLGAVLTGDHMSNCVPDFRRTPSGPAPVIADRKDQMLCDANPQRKFGVWSGTNFTGITVKYSEAHQKHKCWVDYIGQGLNSSDVTFTVVSNKNHFATSKRVLD
ncbi:hypothetical protein PHMEG_00022179 [Phytophthora megakarya]|uniref:FLYWCH-type domain-containing protein n=1 Tax=Phytophthora megakarya TaxID=4795 RepID=A0A225VK33_9STRA|nr:hypothetical protein PHMEG_00022179 [Phytophthora megakarya]